MEVERTTKNIGWAFLIILAMIAAMFSYTYVPIPFEVGLAIFALGCSLVAVWYALWVDVEEEN